MTIQRETYTSCLVIILLPYVILYWLVPFVSNLSVGNDYQSYGIENQMELLFSIKTGSFPLYAPGYALGHSSIALTWSQIFHPISYLASIMPGYWAGKALHWHTFFKLISLGLTQLVLFLFLRKLNIQTLFAFLLSLVTVYNLRMLDLIRFGPALEAYTGHLVLCVSIGWYFLRPSRMIGPLGIILSTYLIVVSGHPQMMYYGLLGSGFFLCVIPFFISTMLPTVQVDFKGILMFWGKSIFFLVLGILLSSVYIFPFYFDFYATNAVRVGSSYEFSLGTQSYLGVLSNFFIPFFSDVHGAFGGSSIILLTVMLPLLMFFRIKIPRAILVVWGLVFFLLLFMLGERTPIHRWVWEYLPFMSAVRNPGRISIMIPIFLMMLMAWIVQEKSYEFNMRNRSMQIAPYSLLALIGALLIPIFVFLYYAFRPPFGFLPPIFINSIPFSIQSFIVVSGAISLVVLFFCGKSQKISPVMGLILCFIVLLQIGTILRYGTFVVPANDRLTFDEIKKQKKESLDYRFHDLPGMLNSSVMEQINNAFFEPFLGKIFTQIIPVKSSEEAYNKMKENRIPQQVFIEKYDPERAASITDKSITLKEGSVQLVYSSFNRMRFKVNTDTPAIFGFPYPYTGHWRASVNGKDVYVYRANGAAHAVEIPKGENIVEFRYWSSAYFWGFLISFTTLSMIGITVFSRPLNRMYKISGIIISLAIGIGCFLLWYGSIYSGDNLQTRYSWSYEGPSQKPNIAYGKKTSGYELPSASYLNRHRSRAVDGDTSPGSGFKINPLDKDELIVDLHTIRQIEQIKLYGRSDSLPVIHLSHNGDRWFKTNDPALIAGTVSSFFQFTFIETSTARFVKVQAFESSLTIDELEVYQK